MPQRLSLAFAEDAYANMRKAEVELLVREHGALVRRLAWHVHSRMASSIELEDLIQTGLVALIEAARTYVDQGHAFATYASVRVRGAMIDQLRRNSAMSRRAMADRRKLAQTRSDLEQRHLRPPTMADMAAALHLSLDAYQAMVDAAQPVQSASIDDIYSDHDGCFADPSASADQLVEVDDMREHLKVLIAELPEREAMILQLFFVEDLNLHEIGAVLGIGAARVCQIKKTALAKLRDRFGELEAV
jgi:RNA polymerase sigma factor for flagellar operon FliA